MQLGWIRKFTVSQISLSWMFQNIHVTKWYPPGYTGTLFMSFLRYFPSLLLVKICLDPAPVVVSCLGFDQNVESKGLRLHFKGAIF